VSVATETEFLLTGTLELSTAGSVSVPAAPTVAELPLAAKRVLIPQLPVRALEPTPAAAAAAVPNMGMPTSPAV
jgi:hypothetical protein